jgi:hypothetical protein
MLIQNPAAVRQTILTNTLSVYSSTVFQIFSFFYPQLAVKGLNVVLVSRTQSKLEDVAKEIGRLTIAT